jgi:prepilin-type N-terminal cleavage/methylation domain-containing protein
MFMWNKAHNAMSLIEVISAMAIISIVCGGLMTAFFQGSRYLYDDQQRAVAFFLAQEKLEELSSGSIFSNLSNCNRVCNQPEGAGLSASIYQNFRIRVNASPINTNLANVAVTVFWGRTDSVTVTCNQNRLTSDGKKIERFVALNTWVANAN